MAENEVRKTFDWTFALLGGLFTAPSVISLLQRSFTLSLAENFADFVAFYRGLTTPLFSVLYFPFQWLDIPAWVGDLHVLSFVGMGVWLRGYLVAHAEIFREAGWRLRAIMLAVCAVLALLFLGLPVLVWVLPVMFGWRGKRTAREYQATALVGWVAVGAVIAFYVGNHISMN
jgi:hypothetical protein